MNSGVDLTLGTRAVSVPAVYIIHVCIDNVAHCAVPDSNACFSGREAERMLANLVFIPCNSLCSKIHVPSFG